MLKLLPILALAAGVVSASSIQTTNCGGVQSLSTDSPYTFTCAQFVGLSSQLQSVQITVDGDIGGGIGPLSDIATIQVKNNSLQTQSGTGKDTSDFSLGALGGFTAGGLVFTVNTGTATFTNIAAGASSAAIAVSGTNTKSFAALLCPGVFCNLYDGSGGTNFTVNVSTLTSLILSFGGGNVAGTQITNGAARVTVTYMYGASQGIPEPTTVSLIGLGLLGVGLLRRKIG